MTSIPQSSNSPQLQFIFDLESESLPARDMARPLKCLRQEVLNSFQPHYFKRNNIMKATSFIRSTATSLTTVVFLIGCSERNTMPTAPELLHTNSALPKVTSTAPILAEQLGSALKTQLLPAPEGTNQLPIGTAIWEQRKGQFKFSVEVQNVPTSGAHKIRVNGNGVGDVKVAYGKGTFEISSETGHTVPTMKSGDVVEVLDPSGQLILRGELK
jgi:hypothetical protein